MEGIREMVQNWHDGCLEQQSSVAWRRTSLGEAESCSFEALAEGVFLTGIWQSEGLRWQFDQAAQG